MFIADKNQKLNYQINPLNDHFCRYIFGAFQTANNNLIITNILDD